MNIYIEYLKCVPNEMSWRIEPSTKNSLGARAAHATSRNREGIIIDASDVILRSNAVVASLHLLPKTDPSLDQLFDSVKIRVIISYKNIKDGVLKTKTQFLKIEN